MIRPVMIVVAIGLVLGAAGDLRQIFVRDSERMIFSEACNYYENRAGSARRSGPGEFVAFLADACAAAEISLETGTPMQQGRAALLLSRIVMLRDTVDQINADRAARATTRVNGARVNMLYRVTPSGEFLIAHRMGLMIAFDAWLDSGAEFSLASYP